MKKLNRRKFIASVAGVAAVTTLIAKQTMKTNDKKQLAHHVFFWLKNRESKEDLNKLIAGLRTLEKIETVRSLHIGVPAPVEKRPVVEDSYSVSELIFFDDVEGQNTYQTHPIHLEFVKNNKDLWEKVVVYDVLSV